MNDSSTSSSLSSQVPMDAAPSKPNHSFVPDDYLRNSEEMLDQPQLSVDAMVGPEDLFNFRYQYLLIHYGTDILRKTFDENIGTTLDQYLQANPNHLQTILSLIKRNVITKDQKVLIPPACMTPSSTSFDISLLACLLRSICRLKNAGNKVWTNPSSNDHSLEADIARLRNCRNKVAHSGTVEVKQSELDSDWKQLCQILGSLNSRLTNSIPNFNDEIKKVETMVLDENLRQIHEQALKLWDEMVKAFDHDVAELLERTSRIELNQVEMKGMIVQNKELVCEKVDLVVEKVSALEVKLDKHLQKSSQECPDDITVLDNSSNKPECLTMNVSSSSSSLSSQVSIDGAPILPSHSFVPDDYPRNSEEMLSVDAMVGPEESGTRFQSSVSISNDNRQQVNQPSQTSRNVSQLYYSRFGSTSSIEASSLTTSDNWKNELKQYEDKMPPEIKIGFFDVVIIYHEDDRDAAQNFHRHLISDIKVGKEPIRTILYDGPEMMALCGSRIKDLEQAVERSTYVFLYVTEIFLRDDWTTLCSDSCLTETIDDQIKKWSVRPVYIEKPGETFKVPMVIKSLKGIHYYKDNQHYRACLATLIKDKIYVRTQKEEKHAIKQKKWIESYKRKQLLQTEDCKRVFMFEEEMTRIVKENINSSIREHEKLNQLQQQDLQQQQQNLQQQNHQQNLQQQNHQQNLQQQNGQQQQNHQQHLQQQNHQQNQLQQNHQQNLQQQNDQQNQQQQNHQQNLQQQNHQQNQLQQNHQQNQQHQNDQQNQQQQNHQQNLLQHNHQQNQQQQNHQQNQQQRNDQQNQQQQQNQQISLQQHGIQSTQNHSGQDSICYDMPDSELHNDSLIDLPNETGGPSPPSHNLHHFAPQSKVLAQYGSTEIAPISKQFSGICLNEKGTTINTIHVVNNINVTNNVSQPVNNQTTHLHQPDNVQIGSHNNLNTKNNFNQPSGDSDDDESCSQGVNDDDESCSQGVDDDDESCSQGVKYDDESCSQGVNDDENKTEYPTVDNPVMNKSEVPSGARSDTELDIQGGTSPVSADCPPSTLAGVRHSSASPLIQANDKSDDIEGVHLTHAKEVPLAHEPKKELSSPEKNTNECKPRTAMRCEARHFDNENNANNEDTGKRNVNSKLDSSESDHQGSAMFSPERRSNPMELFYNRPNLSGLFSSVQSFEDGENIEHIENGTPV